MLICLIMRVLHPPPTAIMIPVLSAEGLPTTAAGQEGYPL
jgi:hypothetical protein